MGVAVGQWLTSRLASAGGAASVAVSSDDKFWRLAVAQGASTSTVEARLPVPLTPLEVAHAVARWASGEGLSARVVGAEGDALRVVLGAAG